MDEIRRLITVELFTDTFRYIGDIVIIGVGHNKRLTDYLNSSQPFIPILSPKLYTVTGDLIREEDIVIVNKSAIKFVIPLEEAEEKMEERAKKYIDSEKYFKEYMGSPTNTSPPPANSSTTPSRRLRLSSSKDAKDPSSMTPSQKLKFSSQTEKGNISPTQRLRLQEEEG